MKSTNPIPMPPRQADPAAEPERRGADRYPLANPVRLRCGRTGRYLAGRTVNVSTTGVLIDLSPGSRLTDAQPVDLCVTPVGLATLRAEELRPATVVRCEDRPGGQRVACRLREALPESQPLRLAA